MPTIPPSGYFGPTPSGDIGGGIAPISSQSGTENIVYAPDYLEKT
jgi:hypothetical protein